MGELLVWFIRHAESESNAGLPMEDTRLVGLTPKGIEQAQRIATVFTESPSLIVTSPYYRSQVSALPTLERFPMISHEQWPVQEFFYLAHFRGKLSTRQERKDAADAYWQRCDPSFRISAGAETFAELVERVQNTLERLRQREQGFVAIFGHGHFMRVMYWTLFTGSFEVSAERMQQFRAISRQFTVPNTALIKLRFDAQGLWFSQIVTAHLVESAAPPQPGVDVLEAE